MKNYKILVQNYVFSVDEKCPHCNGEFERGVLLTDPPQLQCSKCKKLVNLYSWVKELIINQIV